MKKMLLGILLVLIPLVGQYTVLAESSVDSGIWERRAYVDEFNLPTDEYYVSNVEAITGTFSNSAVTNKTLKAWLFITLDGYNINIRLCEYGSSIVKNPYSDTRYYDVVMMDATGEKHYYNAFMPSNSDMIAFYTSDSQAIIDALYQGGTIRFLICEKDRPTTEYLFAIEDSSGLQNCLGYDYIRESFSEGRLAVGRGDQYGFVDISGNLIIPCEWDVVGDFHDGLARVVKNGLIGYIDTVGTVAIPCVWDDAMSFNNGYAAVKKDGKWGIIDITGNVTIPCEWDSIYSRDVPEAETLFSAQIDGKFGLLKPDGSFAIPCEWDHISSFSEGFAIVEQNGKKGAIDVSGNLVIPCNWEKLSNFLEGLAPAMQDGKWGVVDTSGTLIVPCEWDNMRGFFDGMAAVEKDGKWGFINTSGTLVTPCEWDDAGRFSEGLADVERNGKWGYINSSGELVIDCQFDLATSWKSGIAIAEIEDGWVYLFEEDGVYSCSAVYDLIERFEGECAIVWLNGKSGVIRRNMSLMLNCEYDGIARGDGFFALLKNSMITIVPAN